MKKEKVLLVMAINLLSFSLSFSQDSSYVFREKLVEKKWVPQFSLDARRSFIDGKNVRIRGVKFGVQYEGVHRFGLGFHELDKRIVRNDISVYEDDANDTSSVSINFGYLSLYYEHILYNRKKWEVSLPVHLGGGTIDANYKDTTGKYVNWFRVPVSPLEVSLKGQYRIIKWFAVGPGVGYRFMLTRDQDIKKVFNGGIYTLQLKLLLGEVYRMVFDKKDEQS